MQRFRLRALAIALVLSASVHSVVAARGASTALEQPASPPTNTSGVGTYLGGGTQTGPFNLPLVRTDGNIDTIIHVANATTGSTGLTVTFYNQDGTVDAVRNTGIPATLATWVSTDIDVNSVLGSGFNGTATVSASPSGIAVSVDIVAGGDSDNVDTYTAIVGGSTLAYVPFAPNGSDGFDSVIYVQNPTAIATTATITFWGQGNQVGSTEMRSLPPFGSAQIDARREGLPIFFAGQVQIQSSPQPVAVVADLTGNQAYGAGPVATSIQNNTFYVPRFEFKTNHDNNTWNNALVVANTNSKSSGVSDAFTVTFYNPDGSPAASMTSPSVGPQASWNVNLLNSSNVPLSSGFVGSAIITSTGNAVALVAKVQGNTLLPSALASYSAPSYPPPGPWGYVPGLRKNATVSTGTGSTGFTLFNPGATTQDYQVTYWDHNGGFVKSDTLSLKPNGSYYDDQATDGALPNGFDGSAQIIPMSGGGQPIVAVELAAGSYSPPPASGSAAPTPVATPTPIPGLQPRVFLPLAEDNYAGSGW